MALPFSSFLITEKLVLWFLMTMEPSARLMAPSLFPSVPAVGMVSVPPVPIVNFIWEVSATYGEPGSVTSVST